jgi:hypothetical protein
VHSCASFKAIHSHALQVCPLQVQHNTNKALYDVICATVTVESRSAAIKLCTRFRRQGYGGCFVDTSIEQGLPIQNFVKIAAVSRADKVTSASPFSAYFPFLMKR